MKAYLSNPQTYAATPDGYKGPDLGIYQIIDTGAANKRFQVFDSDGNYSTVVSEITRKWLQDNLPNYLLYIELGIFVWRNNLFNMDLFAIMGNVVRVAQIAAGRARVVGFDATGDPNLCVTNLAALKVERSPYLHQTARGFMPMVQPKQKDDDHVPNSVWIPIERLVKI